MRFLTLSLPVLATFVAYVAAAEDDEVKIEVLHAVECNRKTQRGDEIEVHYRGTLASDGSEFDASYNRGKPLSFTVGNGQVIKGLVTIAGKYSTVANISPIARWDDNLLDMCVGEKRKLTIPPKFGYGDRGAGPIPAKSTLIFETELMSINNKKDEL
ncbi:MAG: Peptidyl-prolyl cis-trans isomerase fpr2 [Candelina mexicana]|nr:MAG: Peptidyl-prolyl cis-trans isomerase fpr2 [Candelina mexicana]